MELLLILVLSVPVAALWRAALRLLESIPRCNADFDLAGGVA